MCCTIIPIGVLQLQLTICKQTFVEYDKKLASANCCRVSLFAPRKLHGGNVWSFHPHLWTMMHTAIFPPTFAVSVLRAQLCKLRCQVKRVQHFASGLPLGCWCKQCTFSWLHRWMLIDSFVWIYMIPLSSDHLNMCRVEPHSQHARLQTGLSQSHNKQWMVCSRLITAVHTAALLNIIKLFNLSGDTSDIPILKWRLWTSKPTYGATSQCPPMRPMSVWRWTEKEY